MRYCECGRELEKYQRYCSECGYVRRQISMDIARHTYANSEKGRIFIKQYQSAYEKTEACKKRRKQYRMTEHFRKLRRDYMREYKRLRRSA